MVSTEHEYLNLEELAHTGGLRNAPSAEIIIQIENGRVVLDGSHTLHAPQDGTPIQDYFWSARVSNPAPLTVSEPPEFAGQPLNGVQNGQVNTPRIVLQPPTADGEYYVSLRVVDQNGRFDTTEIYFVVEDGQPRLDEWDWQNTAWVENAVVYGVIPRNFGEPGFQFQGITARLDDLRDLGVTALWLAPVNTTPPGNYGYHVLNYLELSEPSGTKEDFKRMVDEAHQRGIRVLMDFVPNHTSEHHRYFQDTLQKGPDSRYWDFYDRDENGKHTYYFHWTYLPNLNFNNPAVVRWITEAFTYWVREFGVDGFRVDVAWGIRQRNPEYWPEWRRALKRIKPDLLLLAEAGARDPYYFSEGYDAAYDWTDELGHWAWEKVFEDREQLTARMHEALTNQGRGFHSDALIFRFLNNNDTGERFITRYGPEMNRVATALLFSLPGIPSIYTGDEVGAEFMPYKNPEPLTWEERQPGLRDYHKKLIALYKEVPALHSRQWEILPVEPRQQVYAYLRYVGEKEQPVLVLLNFFDTPAQAQVTLPEGFASLANVGELTDLITGQPVKVSGTDPLTVEIPAMTAYWLTATRA